MRSRGGHWCRYWPSGPGSSGTAGKFPDRLSVLVPDELPSLPIDPLFRTAVRLRSLGWAVRSSLYILPFMGTALERTGSQSSSARELAALQRRS